MSRALTDDTLIDDRLIPLKDAGSGRYLFSFLKAEAESGRLVACRIGNKLFVRPSNFRAFEEKVKPKWWRQEQQDGEGIYVIGFANYIKIGWSTNIRGRLETLQLGVPEALKLYGIITGERRTEPRLHRRFADHRLRGEWFRYEGELRAWIDDLAHQEIRPEPIRLDRL